MSVLQKGAKKAKEAKSGIKRMLTEFEMAMEEAQRNAALPVEQGGLGLPPDNTAMDRARAMGFDLSKKLYHGTEQDIKAFKGRTFLSDSSDEASAYAGVNNLSQSMAIDKRIEAIGRAKIGDKEFGDVPYIGIISDIPNYERKGIWATDQGVIKFNDDGKTYSFVDNAVIDDDAELKYKDGEMIVSIIKGDGASAYDEKINELKEFQGKYPYNSPNVLDLVVKSGNYASMPMLDANLLGERLYSKIPESGSLRDKYNSVERQAAELKNRGYIGIDTESDAALFNPDAEGVKNRIVFDPKNIRSRFAAFDPMKRNSSNILAGAGAGVATMVGSRQPSEEERRQSAIDKMVRQMAYGEGWQ